MQGKSFIGFWRQWPDETLSLRGAQLANLLLLLAIASGLAQLSWRLWPQAQQSLAPVPLSEVRGETSAADAAGLKQAAAAHLFGIAEQAPAMPAAPVDAPDTRLNLQLRGVMAAESQTLARAIIAQGKGGEELLYKVGEALPGGATLHAIHSDRVILRRNGRFETLRLPKLSSSAGVVSAAPARTPTPRVGGSPAQENVADTLRAYRQKMQSNPQVLSKLARIQPVMADGRLKGYRVSPSQERLLFTRVGLRSGDIVTEINGIQVSDSARMGDLLKELTTAPRLNVGVERRGQPTTISINLGQ